MRRALRLAAGVAALSTGVGLTASPAPAAAVPLLAPFTELTLQWPGPPGLVTFLGSGGPLSQSEAGSDGRFVFGTTAGNVGIGTLGGSVSVFNSDSAPYDPVTADQTGGTVFARWQDSFPAYFPGSGIGYLRFNMVVSGTTTATALYNSTNTAPILPSAEFRFGAGDSATGDVELADLFGANSTSRDLAIELGDPGEFIDLGAQLNVVGAAYSFGGLTADYLDTGGFSSIELLDADKNFIGDVTLTDVTGAYTLALIGAPTSPSTVPEPRGVWLLAAGLGLFARFQLRRTHGARG